MLLPAPRPIEVRLEGGRVRLVQAGGRRLRVCRDAGPERLEGGWWGPHPFRRDYHRLELSDGRRLWAFRDREGGGWWAHGWFD